MKIITIDLCNNPNEPFLEVRLVKELVVHSAFDRITYAYLSIFNFVGWYARYWVCLLRCDCQQLLDFVPAVIVKQNLLLVRADCNNLEDLIGDSVVVQPYPLAFVQPADAYSFSTNISCKYHQLDV